MEQSPPLIRRNMTIMLILVSFFFLIVFGIYAGKKIKFWIGMSFYTPPAVKVSTTTATTKTWRSYLTSVGTLTAINGVDLSSQVAGIVKEIRFNSGQFVNKNDVVVVMDTSVEEALLKDNQAKLKLAQLNYDRDKKLFERNVSSQAALDQSFAQLQEAEAGVQNIQAQINQKIITAPFSGRIGIRLVSLGQYIAPGTPMVTLQELNPLYVNLNLPEQNLPQLYLNQPVDAIVNFGGGKTIAGKINAINSKVDQVTRNILIQATIPNDSLTLYPGMYAQIKVWLKEQNNMVVVPQTAISYSLSGDYVFIVRDESKDKNKKDLHVYRQYIKVGERRDAEASILEGLKAGDVIVTSGQLKLQNGTQVIIDNSVEI